MATHFDIVEHGARPDGKTINTAAIQRAIDACHGAGGGVVLCGPGTFLTGSLELKSHVEMRLLNGCRIVGSTSLDDYEDFRAPGFRAEYAAEKSTRHLLRAVRAENVAITGPGEINGSGLAFYGAETSGRFFPKPPTPRPRMVMFYQCRNVRFEGPAFIDSPCWTFWLMQCERVFVRGVTVAGDQRMINNDGIDIDACRDVTISDSIFRTGDDCIIVRAIQKVYETPAVCENVTVTNCVLDSWCQGIRIGCPSDAVIRRCSFSNIVINSPANGVIIQNPKRYLSAGSEGSADISDLVFSNFVVTCGARPIWIFVEAGIRLKRLANVSFSGFRARGDHCLVQGSPETIVENITFSDFHLATTGESALVCRWCRNVRLDNVTVDNPGAG